MKYISLLLFKCLVTIFRILPFNVMYKCSNFLAWLLHKMVGYRIKVVDENLDLVGPNVFSTTKSEIKKQIYLNLADISLESIKGLTMSPKTLKERHKWMNPELLDDAYQRHKSIILVTGHFNNWEWGAFSPSYFLKHKVIGLYKPLTNKLLNKYVLKKRASSGTVLADINDTNKYFDEYHDQKSIFLMAADQSPTKPELAIWTRFLGIKTPCLHGVEKYVEKYKLPVVYCDIQRVKRGFYTLELSWIRKIEDAPYVYGDITKKFMAELEKRILKNPGSWLWSHRRWKHKDFKNAVKSSNISNE